MQYGIIKNNIFQTKKAEEKIVEIIYKNNFPSNGKTRTGITCKKTIQVVGGLLLKMQIFRSYVKYFLVFPSAKNCRILDWFIEISFHELSNHVS